MSEALIRIVYVSRNTIEGDEVDRSVECAKILESSRCRNSQNGITGALLFNGGFFAQVLEGPRSVIEGTLSRIEFDKRHDYLAVLSNREVAHRVFEDWSMAELEMPTGAPKASLQVLLERAFLSPPESGEELLDMMRSLVMR
nr:BLUF domain-containing protein [Acidisarcina polymorpha]